MPLRNGATLDEVFAGYQVAGDDYLLLFMTGYETYLSVTQHDEYDQQFAAAIEQYMTPVWTDEVCATRCTDGKRQVMVDCPNSGLVLDFSKTSLTQNPQGQGVPCLYRA